ncbi:cob(I)yrinic acid a,c-diamide adenosyltransferase [Streptococcus pluranimalium]|uniref:Corrinoid adenosyltransferase n=1 Tax=Streptococcus pluranimalium TaxID=82348 RepID=A0A345VM94_9STRE|nr:cob(I)yrinic acid a,c-diamide adenosyltransferase [Streptococcus pluranimalium]AXJ13846.1 Cob(I)yrinic acid a,c-diamide adenosyltransferase [Streptococcus pluranimalium]
MQIYTRVGDKGFTSVIGGEKLAKDSDRVRAYGELDELNSYLGFAIGFIEDSKIVSELFEVQKLIFDCGSDIADPKRLQQRISQENIDWLEERIDIYSKIPEEVESFILPGGSHAGASLHVCRTIARRAERSIVTFQWVNDLAKEDLKFVNRLSDYFYALARVLNKNDNYDDVLYDRGGKVFHTDITKKDIS